MTTTTTMAGGRVDMPVEPGDNCAPPVPAPMTRPADSVPGLADLVDVQTLQLLMDDFYATAGVPMALLDSTGAVLVGAGWQDACVRFHRVNPETCARCLTSDTVLTADIPAGESRLYRCENGMWDAATPVLVEGQRVGHLFTGQFFFDDEVIDYDFFRAQAHRYGFDEIRYLDAITAAPRLKRSTIDAGLRFLAGLSSLISRLGLSNLQLARAESDLQRALLEQTASTERLAAERGVLQAVMENTDTCLAYLDCEFNFVAVNDTYARGSGHTAGDLIGRNHFELFPDAENEAIFAATRATGRPVEFRAKPFRFPGQPWRGVTYWDWRLTPVNDRDGALHGFAFSLLDVTQAVRQRAFSDAINRLDEVIHANLDFATVLARALPELAAASGCEVLVAALRTPEGRWSVPAVFGIGDDVQIPVFDDDVFPAAGGEPALDRPIVIELGRESRASTLADALGMKAALIAPLSLSGVLLGAVLYGYTSGPGEFDELVIDFAGKIAASMSLGLGNARLFHDAMHSARLSGALAKVNEILLSVVTYEDVIARLVGEVSEVAGADMSLVIDVRGDSYTVTHVRNVSDELVGTPRDASYFPGFALAASMRQPLLIADNWADPRTNKEFVVPHGLRAFQLLPLMPQGEVTGVLALAYAEPQEFDGHDHKSAERMCAAMSVALNNALLYENEHHVALALEAELDRSTVLKEMAAALAASLDSAQLSEQALSSAARLLGARAGGVYIMSGSGDTAVPIASFGFDASALARHDIPLDDSTLTGRALTTGEIQVATEDTVPPETARRIAIIGLDGNRYVAIPIRVRGTMMGALGLTLPGSRPFEDAELELYRAVGDQMSAGFGRARLYDSEHTIAETLQDTLVQIPEVVPAVAFSRAYESATYEAGRVGGDFVDIFEARPHSVGITLGDVSGKGLDAAVTTALVRTTLRAHALDSLSPAELAEKVNQVMRRFTKADSFVTLWFGLLNTRTGALRYVSAGHPPAFVISADGTIRALELGDPLLGVYDITFTTRTDVLGRGDRLVLYSDGVTEARSPAGVFLGEEGLLDILDRHAAEETGALADAIMQEVVTFSEGALRDDAAVLTVEPLKLRRRGRII